MVFQAISLTYCDKFEIQLKRSECHNCLGRFQDDSASCKFYCFHIKVIHPGDAYVHYSPFWGKFAEARRGVERGIAGIINLRFASLSRLKFYANNPLAGLLFACKSTWLQVETSCQLGAGLKISNLKHKFKLAEIRRKLIDTDIIDS